jgi:hypothetical protein
MTTTPNAAREQLTKLAEALYRFSQSLDSSFAIHLKQTAVELAGALEAGDQAMIAGILAKARGVVALGERVGAIAANDVQVISAAISRSRNLALPVPAKKENAASVEVFAELAQGADVQPVRAAEVAPADTATKQEEKQQSHPAASQPVQQERTGSIARMTITATSVPSAADRQGRIVAAIRQNPNARMRDLLAALPGVSERTIRYDLERLVSSGTIEREGIGGPATWYRLKEGVTR